MTKITIEGADSVHRARFRERRSEIMQFPDGIKRLVTLSLGHWDMLNWLEANDYFMRAEVMDIAFEVCAKSNGIDHVRFNEWLLRDVALAIEDGVAIARELTSEFRDSSKSPC